MHLKCIRVGIDPPFFPVLSQRIFDSSHMHINPSYPCGHSLLFTSRCISMRVRVALIYSLCVSPLLATSTIVITQLNIKTDRKNSSISPIQMCPTARQCINCSLRQCTKPAYYLIRSLALFSERNSSTFTHAMNHRLRAHKTAIIFNTY